MARWIESLSEGHIVKVADDLPLPEGWAERDDTEPTEDVAALLADREELVAEVDRLRALVGEPEWEYGVRHLGMVQTFYERFARQRAAEGRGHLVRRRKAGPWEPVPETGDDQ